MGLVFIPWKAHNDARLCSLEDRRYPTKQAQLDCLEPVCFKLLYSQTHLAAISLEKPPVYIGQFFLFLFGGRKRPSDSTLTQT